MNIAIHADRLDMHVAGSLYIAATQIAGLHITPPSEAEVVINIDSIHNVGLLRGKRTIYWEIDDNLHKGKNQEYYDVDKLFTVSPSRLSYYPKGTTALPVAAEPTIHYDWGFDKQYDIVFIAELSSDPSYSLRKQIWGDISSRFNVRDGKCEPQNYPKELSKGKLLFNVNPQVDKEPPLIITRFFESMAIGCLLQNYHETLDEYATRNEHYIPFTTSEDAIERIKFYLTRPELIDRIKNNARRNILERHTWVHRLKTLLK